MNYGTLLIIDDNPAILTAAKICLAGTFGRIVTLPSPEKALHVIAEEQPQAILLDMNFSMGVSSGQEGMMWLSAIHRRFPDTPMGEPVSYTLLPDGRKAGILAGANVMMPNFTPPAQRNAYALYAGKTDSAREAADNLTLVLQELESIGYHV